MSDSEMNEPMVLDGVEQQQPSRPALMPGAQLAAHRQALGWSVEQVANQLNLASRQIQAIEADNYAALPGMVIVRGFIRSYAKLLKVDATPLLAMITDGAANSGASVVLRNTLSAPFSETRLPLMNRQGLQSKWTAGVLLFVLLLVVALIAQRLGWIPVWSESLSLNVNKGTPFLSASTPSASKQATVSAVEPVLSNSAIDTNGAAKVALEQMSVIAASAVASSDEQTATSKDLLVLKLREDSWIEIKRADNTVLVSRVLKAATTETFVISEPVSMVLGNAAGVDASLRGTPVDLKSGTNSNVARLNLK